MASAILGRVTEEASNNGRFAETVWHMTNSKTEDLPGDEECLTVVEENSGAWCTTMVDVVGDSRCGARVIYIAHTSPRIIHQFKMQAVWGREKAPASL